MEVVAALSDQEQLAAVLREHKPDLLVLDLRMPAGDGLSLLRRIRAEGIDTPTLILTMSDSEVDLSAALRAAGAAAAASANREVWTMSSAEQPRDRSLAERARPCRIGP